ncbi:unnamed protein product [Rotaria sordida]|uniref:FYVE-type domain-containing protein n=1 Tax=Rotaria sordida TaxID=392033 RepID=A0A819CMJ8_9BILA|nr:unnamed protein product [Rotaria sordida]CAF0888409.1 unnamed protein product [Rotaria sordida]CAF3646836.1 unnamed protein product [Rotaria sordida]CAF3730672.1 unnamed protein product [Rotaria sordida]CAF3810407.1 unnamed protein product [Rotaria sordida]
MNSICSSCKQSILNNSLKKFCGSCQQIYCSNCLYQRIAIPKLNYQMHEVCTQCYHSISTEIMLQKPPKNFLKRLEQYQQPSLSSSKQIQMPINELDPETKALEERLEKLRMDFPGKSINNISNKISTNPNDLIKQMHDELSIQQHNDNSLAQRLRILHETMPAATPDTVILSSTKKSEEQSNDNNDDDDDEFPWCTVCNANATKRCLDCDELFCESCVKKIHRQSDYKKHQLESYKPSAKAKKKYNYY